MISKLSYEVWTDDAWLPWLNHLYLSKMYVHTHTRSILLTFNIVFVSPRRTQYSRHTGCRGFPKLRRWIAKYVIHRREFVASWECEHRRNSANVFHVMVKLALFDVPQKILSKTGILAIYIFQKNETNEKVTSGEYIRYYNDILLKCTKCIRTECIHTSLA